LSVRLQAKKKIVKINKIENTILEAIVSNTVLKSVAAGLRCFVLLWNLPTGRGGEVKLQLF
jgi:hypothetical protein